MIPIHTWMAANKSLGCANRTNALSAYQIGSCLYIDITSWEMLFPTPGLFWAIMHILIVPFVFFQTITKCSYGRQALVPDISK
jgi:hypothetical protein